MSQDKVKITGRVKVKLIGPDGKVKKEVERNNLVTTVGKNLLAQLIAGDGSPTSPSHMAIGSDNTAPAVGDTTLGTELGRVALDSTSRTDNVITYQATFPAGTGTGTVEEAGLLNAASGGTLVGHFLTGTFTKGASDALIVQWALTVG